jgi:hypothetical protein
MYWAAQEEPTDPKAAIDNHIWINAAEPGAHLFAWKHERGLRLLSKTECIERITIATFKTMGRWSSEVFALYL